MLVAAANPASKLIEFMSGPDFIAARPILERSFNITAGHDENAPTYVVVKRIQGHEPENEILIEWLDGKRSGFEIYSLAPRQSSRHAPRP